MLDMPGGVRANDPNTVELPQPSQGSAARSFGSGRVADLLRVLHIPYAALNPGAAAVVDVRVLPRYGADMQVALTKEANPDRG
jgi:hypothetical protein